MPSRRSAQSAQSTAAAPRIERIGSAPVRKIGEPLRVKGRDWETYVPRDDDDRRIWEVCLQTGEVVRTDGGAAA
jgi:hypothetical protein